MKPRIVKRLTWSAVNSFGNRKRPGRLSVIVDMTKKGVVYAVPREIEHKDYLCEILHTTQEHIMGAPGIAARLIPVHIDLPCDTVEGIVVGLSGAEQAYGIRHSNEDLQNSARRAQEFILNGEVPYHEPIHTKIDYRYSERNSHRH